MPHIVRTTVVVPLAMFGGGAVEGHAFRQELQIAGLPQALSVDTRGNEAHILFSQEAISDLQRATIEVTAEAHDGPAAVLAWQRDTYKQIVNERTGELQALRIAVAKTESQLEEEGALVLGVIDGTSKEAKMLAVTEAYKLRAPGRLSWAQILLAAAMFIVVVLSALLVMGGP